MPFDGLRDGRLAADDLEAVAHAADANRRGHTGRGGFVTGGGSVVDPQEGWFPARLTAVGAADPYGGAVPYALREIEHDGQAAPFAAHGRRAELPGTPAYSLDAGTASVGDTVLARRSERLGYAFEFVRLSGGFWAELVGKVWYPIPKYIEYTWRPVADNPYGSPYVSWYNPYDPYLSGAYGGAYSSFDPYQSGPRPPAYEVNNVDLPFVPLVALSGSYDPYQAGAYFSADPYASRYQRVVVWMRRGSGNYYLFEMEPRWEFVRRASAADAYGYYDGILMAWDQTLGAWRDVEPVYIVDAGADYPP